MNARSLLRSLRKKFFGASAPRHKPFRHQRDLWLERLEERDLFNATPPTILKVTPPDFSNVGATNPTITVQFSEAMDTREVTTSSNYLLFNSSGTQITPLTVTYADTATTHTATVTIPNQLPAGAYTLFLRGDLIHESTDAATLSQPGQLVVANMGESQAKPAQPGPSTVSTINVAGDGTLDTVTSYPLGQSLTSVTPFPPPLLITSADFNGDGINDVAVVTHNTDTVPVTNTLDIFDGLGGTLGFAPTPTIELSLPATADPVALLAFSEQKIDQTASGVHGPDLAVTDFTNGQVIVFKNATQLNGPTSFGAGTPFTVPPPQANVTATPVGLVAADFNGDNKIDLAVADTTPDKNGTFLVAVLPGNGLGAFGAGTNILLDPADKGGGLMFPTDLASGTIDKNPLPDIAVSGNNGVEVLYDISPPTGGFDFNYVPNTTVIAPPIVLKLGTAYTSVAVGQIDQPAGSAFDDIVTTGLITNPAGPGFLAQVTVFTNVGAGSFPGSKTITLPQVRDVNDHVPLTLADLTPAGLAGPPTSATGPLDILLPYTDANANFNEFLVLHNTSTPGSPSFTTTSYQVDNAPVALTVGNGGATNQGAITVVENGQIVNGRNGVGTNGGDINGDGIPDVLTVNIGRVVANLTGRSITVARGVGDGTFLDATTTIEVKGGTASAPIDPAPDAIAVGDLNGDGIPDYVVADSAMNQVEVYLGIAPTRAGGNVTYAAPVAYTVALTTGGKVSGQDPVSVTLADLTGTGVLDIVTANNGDGTISILANNGNGVFNTAPTQIAVGDGPTQVIAGVFDKYGGGATPTKTAEDLVISHDGTGSALTSRGISVLVNANKGDRTFVNNNVPTEYGSGNYATAVAAGDFNADGNLDLVFTNGPLSGPGSVILLAGNGHGNFTQVGSPMSVASNPVSLAVADVNRDGYEDVIIGSQSPNSGTALDVLLNTIGDGFRPPVYTALPNDTPVNSIAVTDLPATVTTTLATDITATQTVIAVNSVHGFPPTAGFNITVDSETMTVTAINGNTLTVTRGVGGTTAAGHTANAVVTAANVFDPYPDLVVGTFPVSLTSPLPVVDNVYTLQGVGDGTFVNALPYEAGGPPTPTTVAVTGDPLVRLDTFFMGGTLVSDNLVQNGTFDARDLNSEEGNLDGWQTASVQDSQGAWATQTVTSAGSFSPLSQVQVPAPDGLYQAVLDEANLQPLPLNSSQGNPNKPSTYSGSNFLYQDVTIPANVASASFTIRLTIDNSSFGQYATGDTNATLDYRSTTADQQVRVDLMDPTAPITATNTDDPGSVYLNVFQSGNGTPLNTTTPLYVTLPDITALAGKTVRIRIAVVNNRGKLVVGVDDVALQVTYNDTGFTGGAPTLTGLRLRNPGYVAGANGLPTTTDPTLVGTVGDRGGVGNVASIAFEAVPGTSAGPFNPNDPAVYKTDFFDGQGNFAVTLPNLAPGTYTVNVRVQDVAGNFTDSQIEFVYAGLSNTAWGAVGPGAIDTTAEKNISYGSVTGEVTAMTADPTDPSGNTILLGSANGGVWRTTDGGNSWTPLTDNLSYNGQPINTPIAAIAFSPQHPNIVYAATGTGDALPTSRVSVGILTSTSGGAPGSWSVMPSSVAVFAGARITGLVLAPSSTPATTPDAIYVGVASGGEFGPGVYRSLDGGKTWTNILTLASLVVPGQFAPPASLASVTSLVLDPRDTKNLYVGLGNIGLVAPRTSAGVWVTSNADSSAPTWNVLLGGDNPAIANDTLPSDLGNTPATVAIGRVTVAEGFASPNNGGTGSDIATLYVLIGNPSHQSPQVQGGSVDYGNGANPDPVTGSTVAGLYKSPDGGLDWTHVMLKANTAAPGANPNFQNINLLGNDANNVGQLVVDPTDVNVVYVGGADNAALSFGLIRVDTGNMRGVDWYLATKADPGTATIPGLAQKMGVSLISPFIDTTNDGDDLTKVAQAVAHGGVYPNNKGTYTGEGVSWYDLESNSFSPDFSSNGNREPQPIAPTPTTTTTSGFAGISASTLSRLPAEVESLSLDRTGRLLIGTQEGAWRAVYHGTSYDYTSGGTGIVTLANLAGSPPTAAVTITTINGNLQISNLTSVASDPLTRGEYYASGYDTGTMTTAGGLGWQTMGLSGPSSGSAPNTAVDSGVVLVATPDPTAPVGTPTTVYRDFAYTQLGSGYFPETSTQSGALDSWGKALSAGISITNAASYFPVLVIDPTKVFDSGVYDDLLLFGTDRIYETRTSSDLWHVVGPNQPLSSAGGVITAAAIAPSKTGVLYAGDNLGEVFVTQNNGGSWSTLGVGVLPAAPVTGIGIDPKNPLIAYVTFGGNGAYSHVWRTTNGGTSWVSIQSNLPPNVPAYSVVTDPRPSAGAPNGHLYLGTEVGVFVSVNQGATWARFGAGSIPNVPVVSLQFNQQLLQLTAATQGRGAFVISVDYVGAHVVSVTPATPVSPGLSSVTVTFSEAISSFPLNQVTITGPTGAAIVPTDVFNASVTPPGQSNPETTWKIDFPAQMADGVYTFKVGPNVLDLVGNPMDQDQDNINGGSDDTYTFQVAISSTDDGQFVTGLYHDLLGHPASTAGFLAAMNVLEPARFAELATVATNYVTNTTARTQLIDDLYSSSSSTASTLGIANLFGVAPTTAQLNSALAQLQQGASIESLLNGLVSTDQFFNLAAVAENDPNFVNQVYTDLLGVAPTGAQLSTAVTQLGKAEAAARLTQSLAFVASNAYIDAFVTSGYIDYLGTAPTSNQLIQWENAFHGGTTQQSFIATLMGKTAYYNNAPNIITPLGQTPPPASPTVFIQAVYQQLFNGSPGTNTATNAQVNYWLGQFALGVTHQQMVQTLEATDTYRQALINQVFEQYLGRAPTAAQRTNWDNNLTAGYSPQFMIANLVSTAEFFAAASGGDTQLHTQDGDWVNEMYALAGAVGPSTAQFNAVTGALDTAEKAARSAVAQGLTSGSAYRTRMVNFVFETYYGRAPTAAQMANWQSYLAMPSAGPGTPARDETLLLDVLSSKEYFFDQTDGSGLHTNAQWVNSLFSSLRIALDPVRAANSVTTILNAYAAQRQAVTRSILNSTEYRTNIITQDFEKYLLRPPTPKQLSSWLANFAAGYTREFEIANLMSTAEFFNDAPAIVGVTSAPNYNLFVQAAFALAYPWLPNAPASVYSYWVPRLQNGSSTRLQFTEMVVSGGYLFSVIDSTHGVVNALYNRFTGVDATAAQIASWQGAYTGISYDIDDSVIAALLSKPAYFLKTQSYPFP